jgi:hypothetical protein
MAVRDVLLNHGRNKAPEWTSEEIGWEIGDMARNLRPS